MAEPQRREKVAICGFSLTTLFQAPFCDDQFDIWGLNELYIHIPRFDRWFQMHSQAEIEASVRDQNHYRWLKECEKPIYMLARRPDIPSSIEYPINNILAMFGNYMTSTVAYMVALAIYEKYKEIHLYGVDMSLETEYRDQRPNVEYLLGFARGMGIHVLIPTDSHLLKASELYGYTMPSLRV
jgi:hypothetical protein